MIIINTRRDTYSKEEAARSSMTVYELINYFDQFDSNESVVLSFDNGDTYGRLAEYRIEEDEKESEWEDDD